MGALMCPEDWVFEPKTLEAVTKEMDEALKATAPKAITTEELAKIKDGAKNAAAKAKNVAEIAMFNANKANFEAVKESMKAFKAFAEEKTETAVKAEANATACQAAIQTQFEKLSTVWGLQLKAALAAVAAKDTAKLAKMTALMPAALLLEQAVTDKIAAIVVKAFTDKGKLDATKKSKESFKAVFDAVTACVEAAKKEGVTLAGCSVPAVSTKDSAFPIVVIILIIVGVLAIAGVAAFFCLRKKNESD